MSTFAIANQKGGVGKTTTAVNLAACVAGAGYPTLLIDIDPQCNATVGARASRERCRRTLYDVLCGDCDARRARSTETPVDLLSLIPAGLGLVGATVELPACPAPSGACATRSPRCAIAIASSLIDCPPSLGPLTVNALVAADR